MNSFKRKRCWENCSFCWSCNVDIIYYFSSKNKWVWRLLILRCFINKLTLNFWFKVLDKWSSCQRNKRFYKRRSKLSAWKIIYRWMQRAAHSKDRMRSSRMCKGSTLNIQKGIQTRRLRSLCQNWCASRRQSKSSSDQSKEENLWQHQRTNFSQNYWEL